MATKKRTAKKSKPKKSKPKKSTVKKSKPKKIAIKKSKSKKSTLKKRPARKRASTAPKARPAMIAPLSDEGDGRGGAEVPRKAPTSDGGVELPR